MRERHGIQAAMQSWDAALHTKLLLLTIEATQNDLAIPATSAEKVAVADSGCREDPAISTAMDTFKGVNWFLFVHDP